MTEDLQGCVANAVLGKYRLETSQEEQHKGMSVARGDRPTQGTLELRSVKTQGADSWNDLATAGTPEFLNSKAGEILSTSPTQYTPSFFFYIHRTYAIHTCGRVSAP
jgi:hypothetical protein